MQEEGTVQSVAAEFTEAMTEVSNTQVQIQDIAHLTLFRLEIDPASTAAQRMQQVLGVELPAGPGQVTGDRRALEILYGTRQIVACLWVAPEIFLVVTQVDGVKLGRALNAALALDEGLVLDVTANRSVVELSGPEASEVLAQTVTFEEVPQIFEMGMAFACQVRGEDMMLWRTDEEQYLMVPRSSSTAPFMASIFDAIDDVQGN